MLNILEQELVFFDIEVFKYDSFVVFKSREKEIIRIFHNDFNGLAEFVQGKTLVGFNNYHYDDKILTYMIELKPQFLIKELNDKIIAGESTNYINRIKFDSLDTRQQIDISQPGLKKIEGNMGRKIYESSISFSLDRPLTKYEFLQSVDYCSYDVDSTIDIFNERIKSYFQPKISLVNMLGNPKAIRWNTTTISANLLTNKKFQKWATVRIPEEMWLLVPGEVRELWLEREKGIVSIEEFGNEIQFGFGGLHGAHKSIKKRKKVKLLDVTSMYPNIILLLNVLGEASQKYKEILEKRIAIKHVDEILSDALKLILNSVFGNLNNEYSLLYNPNALKSVCIYGQIALYELCKRISPFATIVNINTDGVAFIPHDEKYIEAYKQWEQDFSLNLEEKDFDLLVQKDVNNYIAVKGEKMICKGGDVNRFLGDAFFKNNNARILDIALVNKLVHGKDVLATIMENLDKPHLFQYILQAGNTYQGTFDEQGNQYNKVNRIFAAKNEDFCIFKKRKHDDGLVRFPDTPYKMKLWNEDCNEIKDFHKIVDINHYYEIVHKRLERWA